MKVIVLKIKNLNYLKKEIFEIKISKEYFK